MKKPESTYITVGKIGSTYGVLGWVKIRAYTEFGADILSYVPWYLTNKNGDLEAIKIEDGRIQGNSVIAKFVGIDTPEEARLIIGKNISVSRSQLPPLKEGEFYWSDLIGLTVINRGQPLGTVTYLMATGSNDVLVIKGEKEYAIPYLPNEVIKKVDLEKQEIHTDWDLI